MRYAHPPDEHKEKEPLSRAGPPSLRSQHQRKPTPLAQKPCKVGQKVSCVSSFDGQKHTAIVLDLKTERGAASYYVHYAECDKRLDEWVAAAKLSAWAPTPRNLKRGAAQLPGEPASPKAEGSSRKAARHMKRRLEESQQGEENGHDKENHVAQVKNIQVVEFGRYEMDTWYHSPYPEQYASPQARLYVCEYTLKYFRSKGTLIRHLSKLAADSRHPPGDEIYRSAPGSAANGGPGQQGGEAAAPAISVFEVDGKKAKVYCQNLCLLSKLFLDHKTLYYDVDPFLFYILCERDAAGYHLVGYFSKEKSCMEAYNLACILTLPCYQRRGYGRFLIAFAYELSRREGRVGTPERPLSDLGQVSFRSYWTHALLAQLRSSTLRGGEDGSSASVSIKELSEATMILPQDVVDTLGALGMIKYWRGTHLIHADPLALQGLMERGARGGGKGMEVDPACLHWQPLPVQPQRKRP